MFKEMIELLKKEDKKEDEIWRIGRGPINKDFQDFLDGLIDYFELQGIRKLFDETRDEYSISSRDFISQKSDELQYLHYILKEIRPFMSLIFKISRRFNLSKKLQEDKISEDSIINMLENFIDLKRTGRKRVFYKHEKEDFIRFKEKFSKILEYSKKISNFDGITTGSILDHAKAIKEFKITKDQLQDFLNKFQRFTHDCSKATKYRFDKDYLSIEKAHFNVEYSLENYDFWLKCLNDLN